MNVSKLVYGDVDCYIVTSEHNRYYFTGFHSTFGFLIATKAKNYFITDSRYGDVAKAHFESSLCEAIVVPNGRKAMETAIEIIRSEGIKKIGFEDDMSVREFTDFQLNFVGCEFVAKGVYFETLRSVKTEEEIVKIAKAMDISSRAFENMLGEIKIGMTEKELCAELNYQIYRLGADSLAFDTIVASGKNGAHPHAVPSNKKVEKGELVTFDFGGRFEGYCADITRTIAFGKISPEQEKIYNIVLESQLLGVKNLKAGVTGVEIESLVREFFKSKNMNEYFVHSLGHGVGTEIHEEPRLSMANSQPILENCVVTIEPGLYIPDFCGVRIEDTVVVKENGIINLATAEKKLITISK